MDRTDFYATQAEVAKFLKINPRTLRRWKNAGTGPPAATDGRKPYDWPDVYAWCVGPGARAHAISRDVVEAARPRLARHRGRS